MKTFKDYLVELEERRIRREIGEADEPDIGRETELLDDDIESLMEARARAAKKHQLAKQNDPAAAAATAATPTTVTVMNVSNAGDVASKSKSFTISAAGPSTSVKSITTKTRATPRSKRKLVFNQVEQRSQQPKKVVNKGTKSKNSTKSSSTPNTITDIEKMPAAPLRTVKKPPVLTKQRSPIQLIKSPSVRVEELAFDIDLDTENDEVYSKADSSAHSRPTSSNTKQSSTKSKRKNYHSQMAIRMKADLNQYIPWH